jgi:hypothetical protein
VISLLISLASILLLSLAINKHYKDAFGRAIDKKMRVIFKVFGWCGMLLSLILLPSEGVNYVYWLCQVSIIIMLVSFIITKRAD